jgi:hypothetical protein
MACGLQYERLLGAATPFNCTENGFSGDIQRAPYQSQYYSDSDFKKSLPVRGVENPFYFIGAAYLWIEWPFPDDPEIAPQVHGDYAIVVNCTTTVYDVDYQVRNGSVVRFAASESNSSVTNALQTPIGFTGGDSALHEAFSVAGIANTAQEMADNWSALYSRVAISLGVTALQGTRGIDTVYRTPVLVSRIPIAPLASLLVANFLYCVVGVVLTLMAIFAIRDPETKEVLERATIMSLVAGSFEGEHAVAPVKDVDGMFLELSQGSKHRVCIGKLPGGGYAYHIYS